MQQTDENIENTENIEEEVKKPLYKNMFFYIYLLIGFFVLFLLFSFLFPSSGNYKNKIIERPNTQSNLSKIKLMPGLPLIKAGEKFNFEISRDITFTGDLHDVIILVKLPQSIPNRQKIENIEVIPTPIEITDKEDGQYAKIMIPEKSANIIIKGEGVVRNYNLNVAKRINKNIDGELSPSDREKYLSNETGIEIDTKFIKKLASEKIPTATNSVDTAKNVFDFIVNYMRFDLADLNADKGALNALQTHAGVSIDFSKSFVALCREKQLPARIVSGFEIPFQDNKNSDNLKYTWAEVYFPEYGWVSFDTTNTIPESLRYEAKQAKVTPFDLLSALNKYKNYVIYDSSLETLEYQGNGNIKSKNLNIKYSK